MDNTEEIIICKCGHLALDHAAQNGRDHPDANQKTGACECVLSKIQVAELGEHRFKTTVLEISISVNITQKAIRAGLLAWDKDDQACILTDKGLKYFEAQWAKRSVS